MAAAAAARAAGGGGRPRSRTRARSCSPAPSAGNEEEAAPPTCPLCLEDLDSTDQAFLPCPCDYQICLFCLEYIRTRSNGRCPACRQPYDEARFRTKPETLAAAAAAAAARKAGGGGGGSGKGRREGRKSGPGAARVKSNDGSSSDGGRAAAAGGGGGGRQSRGGRAGAAAGSAAGHARHSVSGAVGGGGTSAGGACASSAGAGFAISGGAGSAISGGAGSASSGGPCSSLPPSAATELRDVRVIQRNLAYIVGLPSCLAREAVLSQPQYFGRYGPISNVVVSKSAVQSDADGPSFSAYITYASAGCAIDAIRDADGARVGAGRHLRASFGTTKYCSYFLRGQACARPDCFYLHEIGSEKDSFTKEQMLGSRAAFAEAAEGIGSAGGGAAAAAAGSLSAAPGSRGGGARAAAAAGSGGGGAAAAAAAAAGSGRNRQAREARRSTAGALDAAAAAAASAAGAPGATSGAGGSAAAGFAAPRVRSIYRLQLAQAGSSGGAPVATLFGTPVPAAVIATAAGGGGAWKKTPAPAAAGAVVAGAVGAGAVGALGGGSVFGVGGSSGGGSSGAPRRDWSKAETAESLVRRESSEFPQLGHEDFEAGKTAGGGGRRNSAAWAAAQAPTAPTAQPAAAQPAAAQAAAAQAAAAAAPRLNASPPPAPPAAPPPPAPPAAPPPAPKPLSTDWRAALGAPPPSSPAACEAILRQAFPTSLPTLSNAEMDSGFSAFPPVSLAAVPPDQCDKPAADLMHADGGGRLTGLAPGFAGPFNLGTGLGVNLPIAAPSAGGVPSTAAQAGNHGFDAAAIAAAVSAATAASTGAVSGGAPGGNAPRGNAPGGNAPGGNAPGGVASNVGAPDFPTSAYSGAGPAFSGPVPAPQQAPDHPPFSWDNVPAPDGAVALAAAEFVIGDDDESGTTADQARQGREFSNDGRLREGQPSPPLVPGGAGGGSPPGPVGSVSEAATGPHAASSGPGPAPALRGLEKMYAIADALGLDPAEVYAELRCETRAHEQLVQAQLNSRIAGLLGEGKVAAAAMLERERAVLVRRLIKHRLSTLIERAAENVFYRHHPMGMEAGGAEPAPEAAGSAGLGVRRPSQEGRGRLLRPLAQPPPSPPPPSPPPPSPPPPAPSLPPPADGPGPAPPSAPPAPAASSLRTPSESSQGSPTASAPPPDAPPSPSATCAALPGPALSGPGMRQEEAAGAVAALSSQLEREKAVLEAQLFERAAAVESAAAGSKLELRRVAEALQADLTRLRGEARAHADLLAQVEAELWRQPPAAPARQAHLAQQRADLAQSLVRLHAAYDRKLALSQQMLRERNAFIDTRLEQGRRDVQENRLQAERFWQDRAAEINRLAVAERGQWSGGNGNQAQEGHMHGAGTPQPAPTLVDVLKAILPNANITLGPGPAQSPSAAAAAAPGDQINDSFVMRLSRSAAFE